MGKRGKRERSGIEEKSIGKGKRIAKSENRAKGNGEKALIEDEKKREKNRKKKEKRREKEEMKEREEKTELSNSFTGGTQCITFPILKDNPVGEQDEDPVCEQEDGSKTSCLGGTAVQYWFDFNHLGLVGQKTTDNGQCNTFTILDNDPECEQEDGSKTACSGGTQCNTFPILEDKDPMCEQEDGSKTSFLGGTQGPVPPKNNCNISYLDRGKEQEAGKLPVSPQNNRKTGNRNISLVLGKKRDCKTLYLDSAQGDDIRRPDIISVLDHKQELWTAERDKQENWQGPVLTSPFSEETQEQEKRCNIVESEQEFGKPAPPDIRTSSNIFYVLAKCENKKKVWGNLFRQLPSKQCTLAKCKRKMSFCLESNFMFVVYTSQTKRG